MRHLRLVLPSLLIASSALAQGAPAALLADWQRDKANVLAYVDAMPESAMAFRPTPGVRNFAQQFEHIVSTNVDVAAHLLQQPAPALGDSAQFFHHKAALRAYVAATYDYVLSAMNRATTAQWNQSGPMYGQPAQLPARWFELAHEHSIWTLGQVVPYLRLNGVTPPGYSIPL